MNLRGWLLLVIGLMVVAAPLRAADKEKVKKELGSESYYLSLLNKWGKLPEATQGFYEAAFGILGAKPDAVYADLGADAAFRKRCDDSGTIHLGGPMLGCISPDGAKVWLRTLRPSKVEVAVTVDGVEKHFGPVESKLETDLSVVVPVTGLRPGTSYPYRVLVNGKPVPIPAHAAIVTTPENAKPTTMRLAFGTCPHVWGLGNQKQADLIRSRQPAALLIYGDVSAQDNGHHRGLARAGYLVREGYSAWREMVATIPTYAIWDDHDYFNNDLAGVPAGYTVDEQQRTWEVFRHSWNNPSYGFGDERRGVFLRTRIGPCDIIMTDGRYFRKKGTLLGDDQMKWLEAQLLDCKGPFIILTSGTMWTDYVSNGKDSWGRVDPEARERIFSLIEKHRIPGVLLLSGDRHGARGFRITRPSGYTFYEFEPASLGGRSGPPAKDPAWGDAQLFGISGQYAFGEFAVNTAMADPEVAFRLIHESGDVVYELKLTRSQLTPP